MSLPFQEPVPEAARLSPRLLLIDPIRVLPSLLVPLAGVLVAGGFSPRSFIWAAFGVAGSVLYAVVRWATFSYTITGGRPGALPRLHRPLDPGHPAGAHPGRRRHHPVPPPAARAWRC